MSQAPTDIACRASRQCSGLQAALKAPAVRLHNNDRHDLSQGDICPTATLATSNLPCANPSSS
ncbi:hypothetical protein EMIT047CA2_120001 [Pseudomonas soli]